MEPDPRSGYPGGSPSPNRWQSPRYRGGSGGDRGGRYGSHNDLLSYTPRQNWRGQRTPSPYNSGGGGGYRPRYRNSSPYRGSPGFGYQQQQAHYRQPSPRFQSTPYNNRADKDDIENWVSPQMWEDPWASLMPQQEHKMPEAKPEIGVKTTNKHMPEPEAEYRAEPVTEPEEDSFIDESPQTDGLEIPIKTEATETGGQDPSNEGDVHVTVGQETGAKQT